MTELPDGWESLSNEEYIDADIHGDFVQAWGKRSEGEYKTIVAIYVHKMTKYGNGAVYKIENPSEGQTLTQKLKGFITDSEDPKPVVSTQEESSQTKVTRTEISVQDPEDAVEKAKQVMD